MFAIPVQGFAAASMLFCGQGTAHHGQAAQHKHHAIAPAHDHAQHQAVSEPVADSGGVKLGDGKAAPDLMHKCNVCASCCNAMALPQTALLFTPQQSLQAGPAEPLMVMHSRPLRVPDKPPRA